VHQYSYGLETVCTTVNRDKLRLCMLCVKLSDLEKLIYD
jgi:hypothetical protein